GVAQLTGSAGYVNAHKCFEINSCPRLSDKREAAISFRIGLRFVVRRTWVRQMAMGTTRDAR
ncbi:MAG: hypothetical protein KBG45_05525, partial [Ottowia sp.]|nr:hypothetical protein [Ottowia sp.]